MSFVGPCFAQAKAASEKHLQLKLSDSVSIYSEKAYRKNQGTSFEAIGSVVIISGQDTLYGERASFNFKTGEVKVEGNVRFISGDITIYGSDIVFNSQSGVLDMSNARVITTEFNLVANKISRTSDTSYYAKKAEFTTCKDCTESWLIFGDEIFIEIDQYIQIKHALTKIKGVSVLYFPYIAIPIKSKRESGLLFPTITSRLDEGISYGQPVFWAMDQDKDMTFTPTIMATRGNGLDYEYRQAFTEQSYFNLTNKLINDEIYQPGKTNTDQSGEQYFRHFSDLETHVQWSNDTLTHLNYVGMKDLDMARDFNNYADNHIGESDIGFSFFTESRTEHTNFGIESFYRRNQLVVDPESFDKSYVQTLPSLYLSASPRSVIQSDTLFMKNISFGFDSDFTVFKQQNEQEDINLRNATRVNAKPYMDWHLFNLGPMTAKTTYVYDFQYYKFQDEDQEDFRKNAGIITTEFSFSLDKVFGLAFKQKVPVSKLKKSVIKEKVVAEDNQDHLVGSLPTFEKSLTEESILFVKNSYRHSQEFKFRHHLIAHSDEIGNERFRSQIDQAGGWFDYQDALREEEFSKGSNSTRQDIPLKNTLELQWNNSLIRKTPKTFSPYVDKKYLRDNFDYTKIGYFNLSQGFTLDNEDESGVDRLTRLYTAAGYTTGRWNFSFSDYYFHKTSDHIFNANAQRRFDVFNLLANYNLNSIGEESLKTLRFGAQVRLIDAVGFSFLKEDDLDARENIRSIYQIDLMPDNNCWILNFAYRETVVDSRYSVNWVFNFGNDEFKTYKTNFFDFNRLNL